MRLGLKHEIEGCDGDRAVSVMEIGDESQLSSCEAVSVKTVREYVEKVWLKKNHNCRRSSVLKLSLPQGSMLMKMKKKFVITVKLLRYIKPYLGGLKSITH